MPRELPIRLRCPVCEKMVQSSDPEFPFCGPHCRTVDLGRWATGQYVISSPMSDTEEELPDRDPEEEEK